MDSLASEHVQVSFKCLFLPFRYRNTLKAKQYSLKIDQEQRGIENS